MQFSIFARYLQEIEQENSRLRMTVLLAELFRQVTDSEIEIISNMVLGQLEPSYKRTLFNIAEKTIIKIIAFVLKLPVLDIMTYIKQFGDLGLVMQNGHIVAEDDITIDDVYQSLMTLQQYSGPGSQEEKIQHLISLFERIDGLSAKYIIRIILGKLRLGFSDMTIIDALSWMIAGNKSLRTPIEEAYNMCADIGRIAREIKKYGIEGLNNIHVIVGIPIRLASAERLPTPQSVIEKIGPCIAQPKLDGFRLQIHLQKKDDELKIYFFSRNLIDMSYMFPDLSESICTFPVQELICEGEAIVYDPDTQVFLPFQETIKRKRKHDIQSVMEEFPLRLFLFDILYKDGQILWKQPYTIRRAHLEHLMLSMHRYNISIIPEQYMMNADQIEDYFMQVLSEGLEGLVIKRPDALYQAGKRNFNWIKLKRHESGTLEDTIDCVILGYYGGTGKRVHFGIGAILVGVYDVQNDTFTTIAKVGTGLTDAGWKELKQRCDAYQAAQHPKNIICEKELYPDVWIYPEIVCSIRADEITRSPLHTAGKEGQKFGYALRFPRFIEYRVDKKASEATSTHEISRLYEDQYAVQK